MSTVTKNLPDTPCPNCKANLSAATSIDHDDAPTPGDLSVCKYCGELLQFDENLCIIRLTRAEMIKLDPQDQKQLIKIRGEILLTKWNKNK